MSVHGHRLCLSSQRQATLLDGNLAGPLIDDATLSGSFLAGSIVVGQLPALSGHLRCATHRGPISWIERNGQQHVQDVDEGRKEASANGAL